MKGMAICCLAAGAAIGFAGFKSQSQPPKPAAIAPDESPCISLAHKLGMKVTDTNGIPTESAAGKSITYGELACTLDEEGGVRSLHDMSKASRQKAEKPLVSTPDELKAHAAKTLNKMQLKTKWAEAVKPEEAWTPELVEVYYRAEQTASGHSTHGFGGRVAISYNRYTGGVLSYEYRPNAEVDAPTLVVTEAEALASAKKIWEAQAAPRGEIAVHANPQYIRVKGHDGPLPYCWVVSRSVMIDDGRGGKAANPIDSIIIHAETGEILR